MAQSLSFKAMDPIGAQVIGAPPTLEFDDAQLGAVKEALAKYHVLLFRGEPHSDEQLIGFGNRMGKLAGTPGLERELIQMVGEVLEHPSPVLRNNDFEWHTDQGVFRGTRGKETLLESVVIPERGGNTYVVSTYEVYEALPNALKARLDGVRVVSDQRAYTKGFFDPETARSVHPLVVTHPESGRRGLYIQPYATVGILDLPVEEGRELLVDLIDRVLRPERIYKHDWRVGDLLVFDTWACWHRRDSWQKGQPRKLKMAQTAVTVPIFPLPANAPVADLNDMSMLRFDRKETDADHREAALAWARRQGRAQGAAAAE